LGISRRIENNGSNIVGTLLGEPLLLVHAAMDGDGGEVLLHQQLREGDAALHRLHEYHNLNTDIFSIYGFKILIKKHQSVTNDHSVKKPLVAKIQFIYFQGFGSALI
jgi:hypothetical protein